MDKVDYHTFIEMLKELNHYIAEKYDSNYIRSKGNRRFFYDYP